MLSHRPLAGLGRDARRKPELERCRQLLDPSRFDYLFVLVGDGRRWFIPADRIEGGRGLCLGGPKYGEFEVEPGEPIPGCSVELPASTIAS
jgi:hypothetical protein